MADDNLRIQMGYVPANIIATDAVTSNSCIWL